ncbi:MAG: M1 family aminopeptidase [Thermodesulfobacteriota bacterium]
MRIPFVHCLLLLAIALFSSVTASAAVENRLPHYELAATLHPATHQLRATATITLPAGAPRGLPLVLHAGLKPVVITPGATLIGHGKAKGAVELETFLLQMPENMRRVTIRYQGAIHHPLAPRNAAYAHGFDETPGTIGPEGVFLSGPTAWYPQLPFDRCTFRLQVSLPKGWQGVSQGAMTTAAGRTVWTETTPQEEIYLLANRFFVSQQTTGKITAMAFLRQNDPALAQRYLDATGHYLAMYEQLLGPYPYAKFALVENFWETGFGMPSFTLLGPTVLRLPFILHTSYPHEILHNWWGNGVSVDYERGNWSEGLTAYLADHLLKEQEGQGAEYRRGVLQKYSDYAADGRDLPLTGFTSRHSNATEAVGYGKALMLFHMLRQELGDQLFIKGLREFYQANRFRTAGFGEVEQAFSQGAGHDLAPFFRQWVERTGAPRLAVKDVAVNEEQGLFRLQGTLVQEQKDEAYGLTVPLTVTMAGDGPALMATIAMATKEHPFSLTLDRRPLRLDVDPQYDLFRVLDRQESPPALSQIYGTHRLLIVLPEHDPLLPDYRKLAEVLSQGGPEQVEVVNAAALRALPSDRAVLLLGWENRFAAQMSEALMPYGAALGPEGFRLPGRTVARANHSVVAVGRQPKNPEQPLGWIATDVAAAIPGLSRKLPHYHKYGYLAFSGAEPTNTVKGIWPVVASPLTRQITDTPVAMGTLPQRPPLAPSPFALQ